MIVPDDYAIAAVLRDVTRSARVARLRTMQEFAEQEIVLPTGPFRDQRFRTARLPWFKHWFGCVDSGKWRRFVLTGIGQGGKTLGGSALPVMYHLFERRETVVYGAPSMEMCNDKWRQDILPLIEASQYKDLMPESGRGSKGGTVMSLQFKNGATLRFMTGGGDDKTVAGFTTRVVVITESDGFDEASEKSREADRFSQIEARTAAFGDDARVYQECTVSVEDGRTWRELKAGTDSRIILKCPHCEKWSTPEREHFTGWQEARDVMEARQNGILCCPRCGAAWSESDRVTANRNSLIIHRGQDLTDDGKIVGTPAPSLTFAMRFTSVNNLLAPMARVSEEEFNAPRTTDPTLAERKLRQFYWALPSESDTITLSVVDARAVAERGVGATFPRGRVPADALRITMGIDTGKWFCSWVCVAWRPEGTPHVVDYGTIDVPTASMAEELALLAALRQFRDQVINKGFPSVANNQLITPSLTLVDSGHGPHEPAVVVFCNESGTTFFPSKGFGIGQLARRKIFHEPGYEVVPQPAGYSLAEINVDYWKSYVHNRISTPVTANGGLSLFAATFVEHLSFAKQLTAERQVDDFVAGKGAVIRWEALNRKNHYLDALVLACVAGHGVGQKIVMPAPPPQVPIPPDRPRNNRPSYFPPMPKRGSGYSMPPR